MNALVGGLLSSVLGKYIEPEGLRSINISFAGEIKLRNLAVRPEVRATFPLLTCCFSSSTLMSA